MSFSFNRLTPSQPKIYICVFPSVCKILLSVSVVWFYGIRAIVSCVKLVGESEGVSCVCICVCLMRLMVKECFVVIQTREAEVDRNVDDVASRSLDQNCPQAHPPSLLSSLPPSLFSNHSRSGNFVNSFCIVLVFI